MTEMVPQLTIKEEQPDVPPGFTPLVNPGESVHMHNPIQPNKSSPCSKRKRKCKRNQGHKSDPTSRRCRPRSGLSLPPQTHGSDSLFDFDTINASLKAKHGAIDKDCNLDSEWMRRLNLFGVCQMLKDLQKKKLDELSITSLQPYYDIVGDLEKHNFNVKWLSQRLAEIKDAIVSRDRVKVLEATQNELVKEMEDRKEKLKRMKLEIKIMEDQLAGDNKFMEELNDEIRNQRSKYECFNGRSLLDGLV